MPPTSTSGRFPGLEMLECSLSVHDHACACLCDSWQQVCECVYVCVYTCARVCASKTVPLSWENFWSQKTKRHGRKATLMRLIHSYRIVTISLFRGGKKKKKNFTFSVRSFRDGKLSHCWALCCDTMYCYRWIDRSLNAIVAQPKNSHLELTLRMSSKIWQLHLTIPAYLFVETYHTRCHYCRCSFYFRA